MYKFKQVTTSEFLNFLQTQGCFLVEDSSVASIYGCLLVGFHLFEIEKVAFTSIWIWSFLWSCVVQI